MDLIKANVALADDSSVSVVLRDYAIAAAIFLAHAEFENYFVYVLSDLAGTYTSAAGDATKLPSRLRAHLITTRLNLEGLAPKLVSRSRDQEVFSIIERWFTAADNKLIAGTAPLPVISGGDIFGDSTYPSIKNIEKILKRLGVGDPKGELNRIGGGKDIVGLLESISSLRTALAHSATLPGVNVSDVHQRIDGLKEFVLAFDKIVFNQVLTSLSVSDWQAHMC
ncbi:HEPN domain-containing protein [Massilia oculi]|uniref:HEPN domain-containing protein n=1 Tax=Massilia oculi TaxID=945844 RepID=UPI001AAE3F56|nr:HEPN domain-containing protein [Massilia oculi]